MSDNTVLVTGAAGFIGFHTAQRLLKAGRRVVGLDNLNNYYDPKLKEARLRVLSGNQNFEFLRLNLWQMDSFSTPMFKMGSSLRLTEL